MDNIRKIGLLPGTLVYTGDEEDRKAFVTVIYYNKVDYIKKVFNNYLDIEIDHNFDGNIWINVDSLTDIPTIKKIGEMFNIDHLTLEDILNPEQRVKIDKRDDYLHITLKMLSFDEKEEDINYEQISLILKDKVLISFQETPLDPFGNIRYGLINNSVNLNTSYLAYLIIDKIVDNYLFVLDKIEDNIDELEVKVINSATQEDLQEILYLKQDMNILKKFISPAREVISKMQSRDLIKYFPDDMKYYLADLTDHAIISFDTISLLNSRVNELIQLHYSTMSNDMNQIMKILAIISTIFMPLTFICGLYGMNFNYMPELRWKYGYPFSLAIMVLLVLIMLGYFKKRKWL